MKSLEWNYGDRYKDLTYWLYGKVESRDERGGPKVFSKGIGWVMMTNFLCIWKANSLQICRHSTVFCSQGYISKIFWSSIYSWGNLLWYMFGRQLSKKKKITGKLLQLQCSLSTFSHPQINSLSLALVLSYFLSLSGKHNYQYIVTLCLLCQRKIHFPC